MKVDKTESMGKILRGNDQYVGQRVTSPEFDFHKQSVLYKSFILGLCGYILKEKKNGIYEC